MKLPLIGRLFSRGGKHPPAVADVGHRPVASAGYLRDTRSRVLASRPAYLRESRADVAAAWQRAAGLAIDLIQNSGRLRGAVDQVIADTVGVELVLNPQPDLAPLGFAPPEAERYTQRIRARWKRFAWNPLACDQRGKLTVPQIVDVALRHYIAYGEAVGLFGETGMQFCLMSPQRFVQDTLDSERLYQGIRHDATGRPVSYRFRLKDAVIGLDEASDIPAFDQFGRRRVVHVFEPQDAADTRGISPLTAAFRQHIQHETLVDATLQTAILQTVFAATLTSANPSAEAFEALEALDGPERSLRDEFRDYFVAMLDRAAEGKISISGDPTISHLAPGEDLKLLSTGTPGPQFADFNASLSRDMARALGVTYGGLTLDYETATYSSVRMEIASIWPVVMRRRERIAAPIYQAIYERWLDEEIRAGRLWFPGGYERFRENLERVCWAQWRGPAMPSADDLKSARAATERLTNGTSSLEIEAALAGLDADELFDQRLREHRRYVDAGMQSPFSPRAVPPEPVEDGQSSGRKKR